MNFKLFSPMIHSINIIARAQRSGAPILDKEKKEIGRKEPGLKAGKRGKLYFLREQGSRMTSVGGVIKQVKERELIEAGKKEKR